MIFFTPFSYTGIHNDKKKKRVQLTSLYTALISVKEKLLMKVKMQGIYVYPPMHKSGTLHLLANVLIYHRMSLSKSDINFTIRYIRYIRLLIVCSEK